jgi:putative ABC transport system permease protein
MMQLSPLQFIRRDLKRRQKKKAFQLNTKINIMTRFRLRVIFQNIPNYITIFVGVLFAGVILVFGTMLTPLLDYVEEETIANMTATHQYILTMPVETETADAEKFCVGSLKTTGNTLTESISIYGVVDDILYIHADVSGDTVYISSAYADKYSLKKGDHITLKEEFGEETYTLSVDGIYENPTTLAVFLSQSHFNEMMGKDSDYYSGYLSDTGITDIDDALIATEITESDYTKSSRQLKQSMGNMIVVFWLLGVAVFMLVIYLLAKIIIEKNAQSISMSKILGYQKREINQIYIHTTTFVTILSLLIALPLVHLLINWIWHEMMTQYTGWIPCVVLPSIYGKVILIGVATYAVVAALLMRQTNKIPLADALKNVE